MGTDMIHVLVCVVVLASLSLTCAEESKQDLVERSDAETELVRGVREARRGNGNVRKARRSRKRMAGKRKGRKNGKSKAKKGGKKMANQGKGKKNGGRKRKNRGKKRAPVRRQKG